MINANDLSTRFALDAQSLESLRLQAKKDPQQAVKIAAQQFEAVFLEMMLKAMRDATPQDSPFDSEQTRMYTSMLDQQLAQGLSAKGLGLADIMVRQLTQSVVSDAAAASQESGIDLDTAIVPNAIDIAPPRPKIDMPVSTTDRSIGPKHAQEFIDNVWSHALEASKATGIPARFMVGHAALESGWGKHEIRGTDGAQSYNLFGVKAGKNWNGAVVETVTTEYVNGRPQKSVERFRAYGSYAESFRDYANLLRTNSRYVAVLESGQNARGFAHGLQQAGYATDPRYADKLTRILNGTMSRLSLMA